MSSYVPQKSSLKSVSGLQAAFFVRQFFRRKSITHQLVMAFSIGLIL